jgi:hypothetical protein
MTAWLLHDAIEKLKRKREIKRQTYPYTGLERALGFRKVENPNFQTIGT